MKSIITDDSIGFSLMKPSWNGLRLGSSFVAKNGSGNEDGGGFTLQSNDQIVDAEEGGG